jgi:hypothetical protein
MANKYGKSAPHPCHKGNANSIPPQWEWLPSRSQTDVGRMSPVPCWWGCKSVHHYGIRMEESPRKLKYDCLWSRLPLLEGVQRTVSQATIRQLHTCYSTTTHNRPSCGISLGARQRWLGTENVVRVHHRVLSARKRVKFCHCRTRCRTGCHHLKWYAPSS